MDPRKQQPLPPAGQPQNQLPQPVSDQQALPPVDQSGVPNLQASSPSGQPIDYSIDYLNQIAQPTTPTSKKSIFLIWAIIGLSVVAAAVMIFSMLTSRPSSMERTAAVYLRMETLKDVSEKQHRYLGSNQLRVNNRNSITFLTNAIRDIEQPLSAAGITKSKISKDVVGLENKLTDDLNSEFDDARLNTILDRVYTREMTYQLGVLQSMMTGLESQSSNPELKSYVETTKNNLAPVIRTFSEFAATK